MLVLHRKVNEQIIVGDATVTILDVRGKSVRVGIDAPPTMPLARAELPPLVRENSPSHLDAALSSRYDFD